VKYLFSIIFFIFSLFPGAVFADHGESIFNYISSQEESWSSRGWSLSDREAFMQELDDNGNEKGLLQIAYKGLQHSLGQQLLGYLGLSGEDGNQDHWREIMALNQEHGRYFDAPVPPGMMDEVMKTIFEPLPAPFWLLGAGLAALGAGRRIVHH